jgi:hypothetical protein
MLRNFKDQDINTNKINDISYEAFDFVLAPPECHHIP